MFNTAEIYSMDKEFIDSYMQLMSKYLAHQTVQMLSTSEIQEHIAKNTSIGVNMKYLQDKVMPYYLADYLRTIPFPGKHLTFYEMFSSVTISSESLEYAFYPKEDIEHILKILDEVLYYIDDMPSSFKARQSKDFSNFTKLSKELFNKAQYLNVKENVEYNPQLLQDILCNAEIFYTPREKDRGVDFRRLKGSRKRLEIWREGLLYQIYCNKNKLTKERSRHYLA